MAGDEGPFCEVCKQFPIATIFYEDPPELSNGRGLSADEFPKWSWDWTYLVGSRKDCKLCAFLYEMIQSKAESHDILPEHEVCIKVSRCMRKRYDPAEDSDAESSESEHPYPGVAYVYGLDVTDASDGSDTDDRTGFKQEEFAGFILPFGGNDMPGFGRRMHEQLQDASLLKRWLTTCDHEHGDFCAKPLQDQPLDVQLRVLDVATQSICNLPPEARFLALSYVWGGLNQPTLTKDTVVVYSERGSLQNPEILATVADAMKCAFPIVGNPLL